QGAAGGDMNAAIAGAAAPYVAEVIGHQSGLEGMSKVAAHAVANAVLASMQGQNALAGAAGAATGELVGMIALEVYNKPLSELSETEKQTISALATIASGIAGGLAGDSTSSALAGAQSGKTTVDNNALSNWGSLIPPRVEQDASLAFDLGMKGQKTEEIGNAIDASHMGPSWGTTAKVHPTGQISGDFAIGTVGHTYSASVDDNHLSINGGDVYGLGAHGGATIGLSFGPYFPGIVGSPAHDYSVNAGAGAISLGLSGSKDGVGFTFGVGPSWGLSATKVGDVDINANTSEELYRYDFK
ncbi:hemolysin, partial [Trabulsiella guamensis ATCC 49490]